MLTEKSRFTLTTIAVAIAASLARSAAFADDKSQAEVIVVTGSWLGNSEVADLKTYTGNRSIITSDQIERTAARSIDTALQQVPGIKIKDETGTGILPNISVRGLDSSRSGYAQVLLDGIPMTQARAISLEILSEQSMVLLTNEFATREQIERYCRQHEIQPKVMMEANSLSAVIEIVRHTQLTTLLPSNIAKDRDELVSIALAPSLLQRTAVLMQRRGAYQTAAGQEFTMLSQQYCEQS
jgi:DNA-binding transcriptional LysR family regulator